MTAEVTHGLRLLADIGGTNARFALQSDPAGGFDDVEVLAGASYPTLGDAIRAYLDGARARGMAVDSVRHAALAIANPVEGDEIRMTNHHWAFSIDALRQELGLTTLLMVNDFAALAMALPHLPPGGRQRIGRYGAGGSGGRCRRRVAGEAASRFHCCRHAAVHHKIHRTFSPGSVAPARA